MGHLTRDPQTKNLPSGGAVTEFGIACNRKFKGQNGEDREEVTFVDCAAFAKTAELIQQYFTKGKPIFVQGRLKYDSWEDKQGGGKRHKLSVVVDTFQFIGDRDGGGGAGHANTGQGRSSNSSQQRGGPGKFPVTPPVRPAKGAPQQPFGDEVEFQDSDVPF